MSANNAYLYCRGEIYKMNWSEGAVGHEILKKRPCVIVNSTLGTLDIKLIVPIFTWKAEHENQLWRVKLIADNKNGLKKTSGADVLQMRGVSTARLMDKIGELSAPVMEDIADTIAIVVDHECPRTVNSP